MGVAVQDHPGAAARDDLRELALIGQALAPADHAGRRRMVDDDDPKQPFVGARFQRRVQGADLRPAERTGGQARPARHGARQADQQQPVAALQPRFAIRRARQVGAPALAAGLPGVGHVGLVVARHQQQARGRRKAGQPVGGLLELAPQPDLHQIAADGDLVRRLGVEVGGQGGQHRRLMDEAAAATPGGTAQALLDRQRRVCVCQRIGQVQVRQMRQHPFARRVIGGLRRGWFDAGHESRVA